MSTPPPSPEPPSASPVRYPASSGPQRAGGGVLLLVWVLIFVLGLALIALTQSVLGVGALAVGTILAAVDAFRRRSTSTSPVAVPPTSAVAPERSRLYTAGGIAWLLVGLTFILITLFTASAVLTVPSLLHALTPGASLSGVDLQHIADQAPLLRTTFFTGVVSDVFFVVAAPALYVALKGLNRDTVLVAVAFLGLYIVLDLAVTGLTFGSLVTVSQAYATATDPAQQAAYLAVANESHAISSLSQPISSGILSLGILLASLVMREGMFSKLVANLGVITALLGIAYSMSVVLPVLGVFLGLSAEDEAIWFLLMGYQLVRLRRR
ncbi:MAG TPA: DUF4386 family protein [Ktedonobacterales bacterium]